MYAALREKLGFEVPPFYPNMPKGVEKGDVIETIKWGAPKLSVVIGFDGASLVLSLPPGAEEPSKTHIRSIGFRFPQPTAPGGNQMTPFVDSIVHSSRGIVDRIMPSKVQALWEAMTGREKVTALDAMEFLFGTADKIAPKDLRYNAMYKDVPILHLYAAHSVLLRNTTYFSHKTAGIFTCNSPATVEQIKKEKQALKDPSTVSKFIAAVQRKLFSHGDYLPQEPYFKNSPIPMPFIYTEDIWDLKKYPLLISALERYSYVHYTLGVTERDVIDKILTPLRVDKSAANVVALLDRLDVLEPKHNVPLRRLKFEGNDALDPFPTDIKEAYDPKLIEQIEDPDKDARRDLRKLLVYTVDSPSTVEIDDGFSIEYGPDQQEYVLVHIADPTRWIAPNSKLDLAARKRVATLYLHDSTVPLFPHAIARDVMSILPGTRSHALTFKFSLDEHGALKTHEIFPSTLMNIVRTNYDAVDKVLAGDGVEEPVLHRLYEFSLMRKQWREKEGAYVTNYPKAEPKSLGTHVKLDFSSSDYSKAQLLVSELMIITGEIAAKCAVDNKIPLPFRTQAPPDVDSEDYAKFLRSLPPIIREHEYISLATRATAKATPDKHYGVGLAAYARSSSPIRRYYDLLVHHQIKAHLRGQPLPFSEDNVNQILKETSARESEIIAIQRAVVNMWVLRYIQQERCKTFTGLVLRLHEKHMRVLVLETGYHTTVARLFKPPGDEPDGQPQLEPVAKGDKVSLKLKAVNQFSAAFTLEVGKKSS